jgi:hypothetical protein
MQIDPDFITNVELTVIWLLWGWHGMECTFRELKFNSLELSA